MNSSNQSDPRGIGVTVEGFSSRPEALGRVLRLLGGVAEAGQHRLDPGAVRILRTHPGGQSGWRRVVLDLPATGVDVPRSDSRVPIAVERRDGNEDPERAPTTGDRPVLDHVALVVDSLAGAGQAVAGLHPALGPSASWEFPDLRSTAVEIPCDRCYLELNEPWNSTSYLAPIGSGEGGRVAFICLRVADLSRTVDLLRLDGIEVGDCFCVRARPTAATEAPRVIGRVVGIRRGSTGGLPTMLFERNKPLHGQTSGRYPSG